MIFIQACTLLESKFKIQKILYTVVNFASMQYHGMHLIYKKLITHPHALPP